MKNNLLRKIEVFETGSLCITINRLISSVEDEEYYMGELNRVSGNYQKEKRARVYYYRQRGKKKNDKNT